MCVVVGVEAAGAPITGAVACNVCCCCVLGWAGLSSPNHLHVNVVRVEQRFTHTHARAHSPPLTQSLSVCLPFCRTSALPTLPSLPPICALALTLPFVVVCCVLCAVCCVLCAVCCVVMTAWRWWSAGASFVQWFAEEAKRNYGEIVPETTAGRRLLVCGTPSFLASPFLPFAPRGAGTRAHVAHAPSALPL